MLPASPVGRDNVVVSLFGINSTTSVMIDRMCGEDLYALPGQYCEACPAVRSDRSTSLFRSVGAVDEQNVERTTASVTLSRSELNVVFVTTASSMSGILSSPTATARLLCSFHDPIPGMHSGRVVPRSGR